MKKTRVMVAENDGIHVLKFIGDVRVTLSNGIDSYLTALLARSRFRSIVIDLSETVGIDSTSLGLLAKVAIRTQDTFGIVPTIISTNDDITRILMSMGFDQVFVIVSEPVRSLDQLRDLPIEQLSEGEMRQKVLEAHQVLMNLNEGNQLRFRNLVDALEAERRLAS